MKKKTLIKKMLIRNDASIFETLKVLNLTGKKCLFVINKKKKSWLVQLLMVTYEDI